MTENDNHLPEAEPGPDDLIQYAEAKFDQFADAVERQDGAAALGHLRDLAAEGSAQVADRFTTGLAKTGLRNLAAEPFEDEHDEQRRITFLALDVLRPSDPDPYRWSAGQERWYLLTRAVVFDSYVLNGAYTDPARAQLYRMAASLTAEELILWDARHDTRLGPIPPLDPEFRADSRGYVAQEAVAAQGF